jgi:hypothetical protein
MKNGSTYAEIRTLPNPSSAHCRRIDSPAAGSTIARRSARLIVRTCALKITRRAVNHPLIPSINLARVHLIFGRQLGNRRLVAECLSTTSLFKSASSR